MHKSNRVGVLALFLFIVVLTGAAILLALFINSGNSIPGVYTGQYQQFHDCSALATWLNHIKEYQVQPTPYGYLDDRVKGNMGSIPTPSVLPDTISQTEGYSTTNVQVAGVDEADIIKTDGDFIYTIADQKVTIVWSNKGNFTKLAEIKVAGTPQQLFLDHKKLVIYANDYRSYNDDARANPAGSDEVNSFPQYGGSQPITAIYIYDLTSIGSPKFERKVTVEGSYLSARMVDGVTYLVTNFYSRLNDGTISSSTALNFLPQVSDTQQEGQDKFKPAAECSQVSYVDNPTNQFMTITAVPVEGKDVNNKVMLANAQTVYASTNNLYVAATVYPQSTLPCNTISDFLVPRPCVPVIRNNTTVAKTAIYKFGFKAGEVNYLGNAEVEGTLLNQFSLDEYNGNLRVAVNAGEVWNERKGAENNLYIFDADLKQVGQLTGLGKGEKIYAVRYMGTRAYVVTFKNIDPLYVLDLADPQNPRTLGELKIPGYSDYLHPYDANHIIGIGKSTTDLPGTNSAVNQGIKMALFDVTDPTNPRVINQVELGDRGSDSEVLRDHKAFLFAPEKELLVLPISLNVIKNKNTKSTFENGENVFNGFIVYRLNLANGFTELGRVSSDQASIYANYQGSRSLYINDVLITFANEVLQSNQLNSIKSIDKLKLRVVDSEPKVLR